MADLRVTRPRVAVLEAVHDHPHADTETILTAVRSGLPDVSRQAVYDVLNALTAVGLVRRIQPLGMVARYESRVGDNHHHVVCRSCGVIADIDCAVGDPVRRRQRAGGLRSRRGRSHLLGPVPQLFDRNVSITTVITAHFTNP
jgi:Fe2+ or Zn2+ uptake regulation protein